MAKKANFKHLVTNTRVNARGAQFYSAYLWDLNDVQNYSNAAEDAKTVKGAVSKMNKELRERYACCYTQYSDYTYVGKVAIPVGVELPELGCAKNSKSELLEWVEQNWGKDFAEMIK